MAPHRMAQGRTTSHAFTKQGDGMECDPCAPQGLCCGLLWCFVPLRPTACGRCGTTRRSTTRWETTNNNGAADDDAITWHAMGGIRARSPGDALPACRGSDTHSSETSRSVYLRASSGTSISLANLFVLAREVWARTVGRSTKASQLARYHPPSPGSRLPERAPKVCGTMAPPSCMHRSPTVICYA